MSEPPYPLRFRPPLSGPQARGADHRVGALRQARPHPLRADLSHLGCGPERPVALHGLRGPGPRLVGPPGLRGHQPRPARHLILAGARLLSLARRGAGLLRPDRVGGDATLVDGQSRSLRGLLPRLDSMVRRGARAAASGGHQSLGGLVGHLPRSRPAWRYSRDLFLALPAQPLGPLRHRGGGSGRRRRGTSVV